MRAGAAAGSVAASTAAATARPARRFTSARRLLRDLDDLLEGGPVDPVDQLLVDRPDRPLAHAVEAPLVVREAVLRARLVGVGLLGVDSERLAERGQDAPAAHLQVAAPVLGAAAVGAGQAGAAPGWAAQALQAALAEHAAQVLLHV